MPVFSKSSISKLETCHPDLQRLFNAVIKKTDCIIICGHRGEKDQNEAFANGFSKLKYPFGNHNSIPSRAVDVMPYFPEAPHIRWGNRDEWEKYYKTSFTFPAYQTWCNKLTTEFANIVLETAKELGIRVQWGGNWQSFKDMPHYELPKAYEASRKFT